MRAYTAYNLILAAIFLPTVYWLAGRRYRRRTLTIALRVSTLMALIAYPWDFFAIRHRVWRYPIDPGPTIYEVPVNDLVFIWLCTCLACGVLVSIARWEATQTHPEREDTRKQCAGNN